ncbi:MAG TPA: EamA family transporter [Bacteroidia bacterium]|nr:EamA family transporter [Bacteroidia bacterium]
MIQNIQLISSPLQPEKRTAYLQIHVAIFLWGFTAILGRWISLKEVPLVWYRVIITCIGLLFVPGVLRGLKSLTQKKVMIFWGIGCLIALHWVFFYGSIKYSNVSVALAGLATTSLFTSFIEPFIFKKKIRTVEVVLGLMVIAGIYILFNATPQSFITGFIMGLVAAFLAALFSTLNKKYIELAEPAAITFAELAGGFVFLTVCFPIYFQFFPDTSFEPSSADWGYLILLSWVCTAFTMVLSLKALKHLTAFVANLSLNLEPVYGILLAWAIFGENKELSPNFYMGTLVILLSIFLHPIVENEGVKNRVKRMLSRRIS